jgi:hypothetical protein
MLTIFQFHMYYIIEIKKSFLHVKALKGPKWKLAALLLSPCQPVGLTSNDSFFLHGNVFAHIS